MEKKYTIVYVFGPEQCEAKYFEDEVLTREAGEWIKMGETDCDYDLENVILSTEDLKDVAMLRINQISRTGIPVTSKIYDVFIFPYRQQHTDDIIRKRLCDEIFNLENSKQINRQLTGRYVIKAGDEFVYGVRRSQIKYAVQSYDHDLLVAEAKPKDGETIEETLKRVSLIVKICRYNNIDINNTSEGNENITLQRRANLDLDLILKEGDEVRLVNRGEEVKDEEGNVITATYIGGNKFLCRDETSRISYLAKKYLNLYCGMNLQTVNGNEYWHFNGRKLTSYRQD